MSKKQKTNGKELPELPKYHCFNCFNLRIKKWKNKKIFIYCRKGILKYGERDKFSYHASTHKMKIFTAAITCPHFDDKEVYV